jgi:hypothetical protein
LIDDAFHHILRKLGAGKGLRYPHSALWTQGITLVGELNDDLSGRPIFQDASPVFSVLNPMHFLTARLEDLGKTR